MTELPGETCYLNEGGVLVTSQRAEFGDTTYAVANIATVRLGRSTSTRDGGIGMLVMGIAAGGCLLASQSARAEGASPGLCVAFAAGLVVIGLVLVAIGRPLYEIRLRLGDRERMAFRLPDPDLAQRTIAALQRAIAEQGQGSSRGKGDHGQETPAEQSALQG